MPVDRSNVAVHKTDADGGTGDAHRGGDGKGVLREDENGDSGSHLHGTTSGGRVVGDLVTHDLHDVEAVGDETNRDTSGENGDLPDRDGKLGLGGVTGRPGRVDDGPRTDRVSNVVGSVGERGSASGDDLDERVGVLDLVGVLLGVRVDSLHSVTLGGSGNTSLGRVDVVVDTVESADDDHGGESLEEGLDVVPLVDRTISHGVGVEVSHGPSERSLHASHLGVESLLSSGHSLGVGHLQLSERSLRLNVLLLLSDRKLVVELRGTRGRVSELVLVGLGQLGLVVLDDGVVGDNGLGSIGGGSSGEEGRAVRDVVPLDGVVLLDDLGVEVRDEEEGGEEEHSKADAEGDGNNVPCGLLAETELGGSLVDDREGADGGSDEEEEWRGVDGPLDGVSSDVDDELDEHEDDGTEASGDGGGHTETGEDGTETFTLVPSPLDVGGTDSSDTDTSDGRDQ